MAKIKFKIRKDGKVEAEAKDFAGPVCVNATGKFLEDLGKTIKDELTDDYYKDGGEFVEELLE